MPNLCGIWMHLLSVEVNGKDWCITCTQKLNLAYALHTIESVKVVLFVRILERPGWNVQLLLL